jgi:hypothetical protein
MFQAAMQDRNPGVLIFLAKNWLGMTDRQITEHQGNVLFRYVSRAPQDVPARGKKQEIIEIAGSLPPAAGQVTSHDGSDQGKSEK